jgi:predicted RNase H-like nuclease (RuvC/YqgF family)
MSAPRTTQAVRTVKNKGAQNVQDMVNEGKLEPQRAAAAVRSTPKAVQETWTKPEDVPKPTPKKENNPTPKTPASKPDPAQADAKRAERITTLKDEISQLKRQNKELKKANEELKTANYDLRHDNKYLKETYEDLKWSWEKVKHENSALRGEVTQLKLQLHGQQAAE